MGKDGLELAIRGPTKRQTYLFDPDAQQRTVVMLLALLREDPRWRSLFREPPSVMHQRLLVMDPAIVRIFLESGVDPDVLHEGVTPLWALFSRTRVYTDPDSLFAKQQLLVKFGADVNFAEPRGGRTVLMRVVSTHMHMGVVEHLLANGAPAEVRDRKGVAAADIAMPCGRMDIVTLLRGRYPI